MPLRSSSFGRRWREVVCAGVLGVAAPGVPAGAQTAPAPRPPVTEAPPAAPAPDPATAPAPPAAAPTVPATTSDGVLPSWLQLHAEQRTRYETVDARYRSTERGADQQLDFRTRLQVRVQTSRVWAYTEVQDSRITLDDSASTVGTSQVWNTKVVQAHAGVAWRKLGKAGLDLQLEAGRFSRDFGFRRVIARNLYRNTTAAFDGAIARLAGASWTVQALATRPVFYTYPALTRDRRYDDLRFGGIYATSTRIKPANADVYGLRWNDGEAAPAASRRALTTVGARIFGPFGPGRHAEYEVEAALQRGEVGGLDHHAWFQHAQVGYNWPDVTARPRALLLWDYASGDEDPTDDESGAYDLLLGARRFEFGPMGLHGLMARSNLVSPGAWLILRPTAALESGLQVRGIWLAEARDRWRSTGLVDPTGAAGRHVGEQVEWRTRYRFSPHLDFDGAITYFEEGRFVRTLKPAPHGHAIHLYAGLDLHY